MSEEQRKLLIVVNVAWFFVSHRLPLALEAKRRGFDVYIAAAETGSDTSIETIRNAGLKFVPIGVRRGSLNPFGDLSLALDLVRLYWRVRPDVVHHVTIKPVIYGSLVARVLGIRAIVNALSGLGYVFTARGRRAQWLKAVISFVYRIALRAPRTRVIFQNSTDLDDFCGAGLVRRADTVLVPSSGVDLDRYSHSPEPNEIPTVLLPARMLKDKGVVEFAEAARLLKARNIVVRFVLAGSLDADNPAALTEPELLGLCGRCGVQWLGHCANMAELMSRAAIVCLPSYREGSPKALAEAAAASRPVVTCDVPGCRDVVIAGETGLLVPPRDAIALANALQELLVSRELRERFGRAGRALAEARFDVDEIVSKQVDIYEELLDDAVSVVEARG